MTISHPCSWLADITAEQYDGFSISSAVYKITEGNRRHEYIQSVGGISVENEKKNFNTKKVVLYMHAQFSTIRPCVSSRRPWCCDAGWNYDVSVLSASDSLLRDLISVLTAARMLEGWGRTYLGALLISQYNSSSFQCQNYLICISLFTLATKSTRYTISS